MRDYQVIMPLSDVTQMSDALVALNKIKSAVKNIELDFIGEQFMVVEPVGFDSRVELAKIVRIVRGEE